MLNSNAIDNNELKKGKTTSILFKLNKMPYRSFGELKNIMNAFDPINKNIMIDRKKFYDSARESIFHGSLSQNQVFGLDTILKEAEYRNLTDMRQLAYMLATTYHETAHTMEPVAEYGKGKGHKYGEPDPATGQTYYGRGFVQLTWKANYETMSRVTGVDLVNNPDLAMTVPIATKILFYGMLHGSFTGKQLSDYFNDLSTDWIKARRIINGLDKAELIAGYAEKFYNALKA